MVIAAANKAGDDKKDDGDGGCGGGDGTDGHGPEDVEDAHELTMSVDATVTPSDIAYPQDMRLLDEARRYVNKAFLFVGILKAVGKGSFADLTTTPYNEWTYNLFCCSSIDSESGSMTSGKTLRDGPFERITRIADRLIGP